MHISPLCPDLCNYGMHMCGKESLENSFLLFVKGLKSLGNWFMRRFCHGEWAGVPDDGGGWNHRLGWLLCPLQVVEGQDDLRTQKETWVTLGGGHILKIRRSQLSFSIVRQWE